MTTIPTNNGHQSRIETQVEELTNILVKKLEKDGGTYAGIGFSPNTYEMSAMRQVLQNFKNQGWYAYYHERFDGAWIGLQVYSYEYQPSNQGLNKLYQY